MTLTCFFDGKWQPLEEASVPLNDLGLNRGYGVFAYLRTYGGSPFYLDHHLARFFRSAGMLQLNVPYSQEQLKQLVFELLEKNPQDETGVKLLLTGGSSLDGFVPQGSPRLCIQPVPLPKSIPTSESLMTYEHDKSFPSCKSLLYASAILGYLTAQNKGFDDALFVSSKGHVLETGRANFFAFKGSKLITPKQEILSGVTRRIVIELASEHFGVEERAIHVDELATFDEAFITSSIKEIMPVHKIDSHMIQTGHNTKKIQTSFHQFVQSKTWLGSAPQPVS